MNNKKHHKNKLILEKILRLLGINPKYRIINRTFLNLIKMKSKKFLENEIPIIKTLLNKTKIIMIIYL